MPNTTIENNVNSNGPVGAKEKLSNAKCKEKNTLANHSLCKQCNGPIKMKQKRAASAMRGKDATPDLELVQYAYSDNL